MWPSRAFAFSPRPDDRSGCGGLLKRAWWAGVCARIAESWNGSSWTLMSPAVPSGASSTEFLGVSCTSSTSCTAVGAYTNSSGLRVTLVEYWNGSVWTIQSTSSPGSPNVLQSVSCTSTSACTAVGGDYQGGPQLTLVERWNGTSWSVQSSPNPTGSAASYLQDVSCSASSACTAVGDWVEGSINVNLVEYWNGSEWVIQPSPNAPVATFDALYGVSCTSSLNCTSVGHATQGGANTNLAAMNAE